MIAAFSLRYTLSFTLEVLGDACVLSSDAGLIPRLTNILEGKRLLSMDQRVRKQAHDRESQRNLRRRAKEHVEFLEDYIKFLESGVEKLREGMRSEIIDSVLKKNQELEDENRMLKGQLALQMSEFSSHWVSPPNNPRQPFPMTTYTNQIYHPTRAFDDADFFSRHLYSTTTAPRWDHSTEFEQVSSFGVDAISARPVSTNSRQYCQYQ
jgi:hypothetical protein